MIKLTFLGLTIFLSSLSALGMDFEWITTPATASARTGYHIRMSGDIVAGDYEKLRSFIKKDFEKYKSNRYISLSSNGGNLIEALKMATLLRQLYPTVFVEDGKCVSACFYLYLSASTRYATLASLLGIHRAYFDPKYFAGLKLDEARRKQGDLTRALNVILDENDVPQYLKEVMQRTPSSDVYWLSESDVSALRSHPAWFEEFMIAKCDYARFLKAGKDARRKIESGEDLTESETDNIADNLSAFMECEKKTITAELSRLGPELVVK